MSTNNDGGPAFPHQPAVNANGEHILYGDCGMSLRDWFAGQALAGMQASVSCNWTSEQFAKEAYKQADAMLAARNETQTN